MSEAPAVGGSGSASGDGSSVSPTLLAGADHDRESDAYQDEAYAFFLNCFHLKDWEEARCVQARDRVHARVDVISLEAKGLLPRSTGQA